MAALSLEDGQQILTLQHEMLERVEAGLAEIKKLGERTGETEAAIAKINTAWNEVEAKAKRPAQGSGQPSSEEAAEQKKATAAAFKSFLRHGIVGVPREQRDLLLKTRAAQEDIDALQTKALELKAQGEYKSFVIGDDTLGGYFVLPEIIQNEIIKDSVLYTPVRDIARVQPTTANSLEVRYRKTSLSAQWVSEVGTRSETTGQTYGNRTIQTYEMYALIEFSRQQLDDEYMDLEADIVADIAEQFGVTEGAGFVTGTGVGQPTGFLANIPSGNVVAAGTSGTLVYADFAKAFGKLKPAYRNSPNCAWVLHQDILSLARQAVDSEGRPIIQAQALSGLAAGFEERLLNKPYFESTDMPSAMSSTNRVLAVGDFKKAYRFVPRIGMTTLRLQELYATSGKVGLMVYQRVGGELVLPEALAALKNS